MSRLMAFCYDPIMRRAENACLREWRRELLANASGRVLEIGAGTGANLDLYPDAVTDLVVTEPDRHMRAKLEARFPDVTAVDADAESLPYADGSFDTAVCTLVLCSVPDPARALAELHRVLVPEGKLIFLEHVAADDEPRRLTWQRRVEPLWKHLTDGCHTTRRTADTIAAAGFSFITLDRALIARTFPWVRPAIRGLARKGVTF